MLPGTDLAAAGATLRRLTAASVTGWSYGLASYRPGSTLDTLLRDADTDLYRAKSRRRPVAPEHSPV